MPLYIHERAEWPQLGRVRGQQGVPRGRIAALGFSQRDEATLETLIQDAVKSRAGRAIAKRSASAWADASLNHARLTRLTLRQARNRRERTRP